LAGECIQTEAKREAAAVMVTAFVDSRVKVLEAKRIADQLREERDRERRQKLKRWMAAIMIARM